MILMKLGTNSESLQYNFEKEYLRCPCKIVIISTDIKHLSPDEHCLFFSYEKLNIKQFTGVYSVKVCDKFQISSLWPSTMVSCEHDKSQNTVVGII